MRVALLVLLLGCRTTPPAATAPVERDLAPVVVPDAAAPVKDAAPTCVPATTPRATCAAAGADRAAGLRCCVDTCGVDLDADTLRARFVSEVGERVPAEVTVAGLCWTSMPTAPLAEGAQALVFERAPRVDVDVTLADGWALGSGAAVCFAGPRAVADPACAGFRASRRQPGFISLHDHALLGSEKRKEARVQRTLRRRGVDCVAEHVTGPDAEIVRRWFSTYPADARAQVPLEQVLLGRPAALLVKWNPPAGRVSQSVHSVGVVRAGKAVLWTHEGDLNDEVLWPHLARLMKPAEAR